MRGKIAVREVNQCELVRRLPVRLFASYSIGRRRPEAAVAFSSSSSRSSFAVVMDCIELGVSSPLACLSVSAKYNTKIKSRAGGFTPLTLGSQWVRQYPVSGVPGVGCHHTVQGLGSSSRCGIGVSRKTMRGGTWLSISPRWSPVLGPFLYLSVRESYSDNISTVRSCKSNSHILPRARQNGIRPLSTAESFVYDFRTSRGVVRVSSPYPPRDERLRLPLNH